MLSEKRYKVLVVEDEPDRRDLHCIHLASANYWVHEANRLQEADPVRKNDKREIKSVTEQLKTQFFHATIVDLSLSIDGDPNKTGLDVLTAIKSNKEGANSIVITGHGTTRLEREAWKVRGAYDWLDKVDYTKEMLLDIVDKAAKDAKLRVDATMRSNFTYAKLVGNPTLVETQERLNGGGSEIIRSIVEESLRPWYPYDVRYKTSSFDVLHINEIPHTILVVKLWSRYLGGCIEMRLGSREACKFLVEVNKHVSKKEGQDYLEYVLDPNDKLSAVVEYNPSIKLEDLENTISLIE